MILNLGSLSFNADVATGGGTPAWGTEMGQGDGYRFAFEDMEPFLTALVYNSVPDVNNVTCPLGKGGAQTQDYEFVIASLFKKVFVNDIKIQDAEFLLLVVKKIVGTHHVGRRTLKYNPRMTYHGREINNDCYNKMATTLGLSSDAAWFVSEIYTKNQDELHFVAYPLDGSKKIYPSNEDKKNDMFSKLQGASWYRKMRSTHKNADIQKILFGTPGSGKSFKIKDIVAPYKDTTFRTTFHSDSDYATFVGAYKPVKVGKDLTYEFVPQAFTDAYVKAWNFPEEEIFLVIEEINRGNCAQIFGDLFQLLDRDEHNVSEYPINADKDLRKYLETEGILGEGHEGIKDGKLKLPANFHILATMNTSDQSLFPMDSAFKRRWAWEYVPIDLGNEKSQFVITIGDKKYPWASFLKEVNERIHKLSDSEDKQMGNFFIKSDIDVEEFKSKVMFYLWSEVCKDYEKSGSFFKDANNEDAEFTFNSLFPTNTDTNKRLQGFMAYLGVAEKQPETSADGSVEAVSDESTPA